MSWTFSLNRIKRVKNKYSTLPKPKNMDVRSIALNTNPTCEHTQFTIRDSYLRLEILCQSLFGFTAGYSTGD